MNKSSTEWTNPQKSLSYLKAVETFPYRKEGNGDYLLYYGKEEIKIMKDKGIPE